MTWKVRYVDYLAQFRAMEREIMTTIRAVLERGDLILREDLERFEADLAAFCGTAHAVGMSSGTDALRLALAAAEVGPGDEVITVSHSFVATAAAIHHVGAVPVLVDIGDDHLMDVEKLADAVTPRTRAVLPVHLNGRVCEMDAIMKIATEHDLVVVEDAAQALGATFDGTRAGGFGVAGCFSFYPAKLLGALGDAGAVVTSSPELAERLRLLRNHGRLPDGDIAGFSFNCRLDNLQAAVLDLKLTRVPAWIPRRREIARAYDERLRDLPEVVLPPAPEEAGRSFDVFQNYEIEAEDRDRLANHLRAWGIESMLPWGGRGIHQFPRLGLTRFHLARTDLLLRRALMLPMHAELTDDQVPYVADAVRYFYGARP